MSGRRERGNPPITSLLAMSGRRVTSNRRRPIIVFRESRPVKSGGYDTGER